VAFDFFVDPGTVTITLGDGRTETLTAADTPTNVFVGVTGPSGISSVEIIQPYNSDLSTLSINMGDFSYASVTTRSLLRSCCWARASRSLLGSCGAGEQTESGPVPQLSGPQPANTLNKH
jgi:hypothetical protein